MIEIDVEIWTDGSENGTGTGTGAMIETVSQSATGIGIDGGIKNVRLVQIDETATATALIANIVIVALCRVLNLTHTLFLLIQVHCIDWLALLSFFLCR